MDGQWHSALPRPIAFAFSGGASLGVIQVGMLRALRTAGIQPDLIVGTSVGALNGAVIACHGVDAGVEVLADLWRHIRCADIFAGGRVARLGCLLQTGCSLFRPDGLIRLMGETLRVRSFAELQLPLGVVATDLISRRGVIFTQGELQPPLLASSAIPGLLPWVTIHGRRYIDGGFSANVPLSAAYQLGAASIVVLDAGNRRPSQPHTHLVDRLLARVSAGLRKRVVVDAPAMAQKVPLVYLPAPTLPPHRMLDFEASGAIMERAETVVTQFLATASPPVLGRMCGALHFCEVPPTAAPHHEPLVERAHTTFAVA
jgi:NTE family protein